MDAISELIWTGSYGATTIDGICEKAGVRKGSFYHFFDSKADLAVAAIDHQFSARRGVLDAIFSPLVPPLERLVNYCDEGYQMQRELAQKYGFVLGCPLFTLGAEISTQDEKLRSQIEEILDLHLRYIESAIRDAVAQGNVPAADPSVKARMVSAYIEGVLTQARIHNNVEVLRELPEGIFAILGVNLQKAAA
jgi:TetR/AcrR family transcriptional regulator, transcriptional repressor for nem operon